MISPSQPAGSLPGSHVRRAMPPSPSPRSAPHPCLLAHPHAHVLTCSSLPAGSPPEGGAPERWRGFLRAYGNDDGDRLPIFSARSGPRGAAEVRAPSPKPKRRSGGQAAPAGGKPSMADVVSSDEARRMLEDARSRYASSGARAEYSRSKGVDYDRAEIYLPIVTALDVCFQVAEVSAEVAAAEAAAAESAESAEAAEAASPRRFASPDPEDAECCDIEDAPPPARATGIDYGCWDGGIGVMGDWPYET